MNSKVRNTIIRLSALSSIVLGLLIVGVILFAAITLSVGVSDFNLAKIILVDFILVIVSVAVFLLFFGVFEFLLTLLKVEKEVEELEHEVEILEARERDKR